MTLAAATSVLDSAQLLRQILVKIAEATRSEQKSLVVFDLDSTLFDVSPRLQQIIHDFAHLAENHTLFPELIEILKTVRTHRQDWGLQKALQRAGIHHLPESCQQALKEFWLTSFYSNPYLHFDQPFDGAVEFAQAVQKEGAEIVYLSGRDQPRMDVGTREVLFKWGFPLEDNIASLALKPAAHLNDAEFKKDWFLNLPEKKYSKIWFFENEPLNVNVIRQHLPQVDIVFFDSTHCGEAEPPMDLPKISHFIFTDKNQK
jgi:hypothetical protein